MTAAHPDAEPVRLPLDLGVDATEVLRALRGRDRLVALVGAWHAAEALIAFEPVAELPADAPFDVALPGGAAEGAFGGGWIGWWGYRLGGRIEDLPPSPPRPVALPDHVVGFYDRVLRLVDGRWWAEGLCAADELAAWAAEIVGAIGAGGAAQPVAVGPFTMTPSPQEHRDAVAATVEHVHAGDIFQANLCVRLSATFTGDPLDLFCAGVEALAPAYAAYVAWDGGAVVSLSPELFLRRTGSEVLTSPIKGTAPLSADPGELLASAKDRAENVMIVDLMRNDLSRVCAPGSVRVPATARLERHAVWHLVSDVVGHLAPGVDDRDLLRATFPPGSVTGAPKVRAMQVVADLEATGREVYTGAIGHVSAHAGLELNVAIRTFETTSDGAIWLGVGGGIVADSVPEAELAEALVKAAPLVEAIGGTLAVDVPAARPSLGDTAPQPHDERPARASAGVLETLLVVDGHALDVEAHLARLDASVRALYGTTVRAGLEAAVERAATGLSGRHRLRIEAVPAGGDVAIAVRTAPLADEPGPWVLEPLVLRGGWGEHKWLDRARLGPVVPGRDALILDEDGSVLESARASVFVVLDDGVHTPPLDGRILPGTARARLLDVLADAAIPAHQRRLTSADLAAASEIFVTNALRGVVGVAEVTGITRLAPGPVTARLQAAVSQQPRTPTAVSGPPSRSSLGGWATTRTTRVVAGPPPRERPRVLFVDNYDSFVYNLVHDVRELGAETEVVRNDRADVDDLVRRAAAGELTHLVISPGPGTPAEAGISAELVRRLGPAVPTLGVCLGHQVIAEVYGAAVVRAAEVVHGKPSLVHHAGAGVLAGLPSPLTCARYHSLVVDPATIGSDLEITARTASGVVMGLRHRVHPVEGVQMHPESVLTHGGHDMIATFLRRHRVAGEPPRTPGLR